eukprot:6339584-Prymnesium_polylepis.1
MRDAWGRGDCRVTRCRVLLAPGIAGGGRGCWGPGRATKQRLARRPRARLLCGRGRRHARQLEDGGGCARDRRRGRVLEESSGSGAEG